MEILVKDMRIDRRAEDKIDNGGIVASATILVNNTFVISNVNLVSGKNGLCVLMPGMQKEDGRYQDYAFFNTKEERDKLTVLIMKEYMNRTSFLNEPYLKDMKVNLYINESGNQKAYATIVIGEKMHINRIRVMSGPDGLFVSMPKYKDALGNYHEIISLPTPDAYRAVTELVLKEYFRQLEMIKAAA